MRDISDGLKAIESILSDYRQRYVLRYTARDVAPDGWHTITVTMPSFPQYQVEARKGYVGR